ncbi:hypothetical protein [Porphyrobacter sp. YT40]|uniref:hypothetical protein n=1 Tax=Porphyrobacter sp. YT40 TaxID=2547601 RepID=UPI0011430BEF|nr:hypothetical protein [Porphyrobacter sp. YT40]QDH32909.1 hypothetical protein E2E27_00250 [Porphyrobacter sp. YT40]
MDLRRAAAAMAWAAACWAAPAAASDKDCQLLPPDVEGAAIYVGYSESRMCEAGLKPLWQGLPDGAEQVMRFTFTSGHDLFWRSVTITLRPDGTGLLEVVGGGFKRRDVRSPWVEMRKVRRRLSSEARARLVALAEQSGTFDHAVGTWDRRADGETEVFLHCQTLGMERADAAGYRISTVNVGCNRPAKLMPLVNEVIRLGGIGMVRRNWSVYQ